MISEVLAFLIAFIVTFIATKKMIPYLKAIGMSGIDIQKIDKRIVAESGGPSILAGFITGIFFFIGIKIFIYGAVPNLVELFAAITTIMIITFIGVFDETSNLLRKAGIKRAGLKRWQKPLLTLPAVLPLVAIFAGQSSMYIPFFGTVDFGILFPLLIIPLAIVGAPNAYNMLAGMNGLEAGMGIIIISAIGLFGYINQEFIATDIALCVVGALVAFLLYNRYPAKIFPGDSTNYLIGASIAVIAILGNMETFALLCFAPYFIEFVLKARSKLKAESFGMPQKDGTLQAPYEKIYSLTHVVMKLGRFKEWQVVGIICLAEVVVCGIAYLVITYL